MKNQINAEYDFLGRLAVAGNIGSYQESAVSFCNMAYSVQSILAVRFHRTGSPEILFRWIPDEKLRMTFDRYYGKLGFLLDPFYGLAMETSDWTACHLREIAPDRFETSDYFSNYFGATEMVDELGFVARIDGDSAAHFSMGRNAGRRRFKSDEVMRFKRLARVLAPKLRSLLHVRLPDMLDDAIKLEHHFCELSKARHQEISLREGEVAGLIVQGHSSRAIGLKLGISVQTVKVHRRNLYKKLRISSQNELFGLLTVFVDRPESSA